MKVAFFKSLAAVSMAALVSVACAQDSLHVRRSAEILLGWDQVSDLAVAGNYAYLATGSGLHVVNVSNTASPCEVGSLDIPGGASCIAVSGHYVFLSHGIPPCYVVDVADPAHPVQAATFGSTYEFDQMVVSGNLLCALDTWQNYLHLTSISSPEFPVAAGECSIPPGATELAAAGNHAFITYGSGNTCRLNVYSLTGPTSQGSAATYTAATGIAASDTLVMVSETGQGLQVFSVADPVHPVSRALFYMANIQKVAVSGLTAFVTQSHGITVVNLANPSSPQQLGSCAVGDTLTTGTVRVQNNTVSLALYPSQVQLIDVTSLQSPVLSGHCGNASMVSAAVRSDSFLFAADAAYGLRVFDLSNPRIPLATASLWLPHGANGLSVNGDYAYACNVDGRFYCLNVGNPGAPGLAGFCDMNTFHSPTYGIAHYDHYVYVARSMSGVILDVADPQAPTEVGQFSSWYITSICVIGSYLYQCWGDSLPYIYSLADPEHPAFVGFGPAAANEIAVSGDYACFAAYDFSMVNIQDPANPVLAGTLQVSDPGSLPGVAEAGSLASVFDNSRHLNVLDISDPQNPTVVGHYYYDAASHFGFNGIAALDSFAYVFSNGRLTTFDHTRTPERTVSPVTLTPVNRLLLSAYPNPFNPRSEIRFELGRTSHVRLNVYDITGRLVERLLDGSLPAGIHNTTFKADNLSSGMYFCRLQSDLGSRTQKLMLLR